MIMIVIQFCLLGAMKVQTNCQNEKSCLHTLQVSNLFHLLYKSQFVSKEDALSAINRQKGNWQYSYIAI